VRSNLKRSQDAWRPKSKLCITCEPCLPVCSLSRTFASQAFSSKHIMTLWISFINASMVDYERKSEMENAVMEVMINYE
jgi:Fe-S-cluster-containing hydrogenase component 2